MNPDAVKSQAAIHVRMELISSFSESVCNSTLKQLITQEDFIAFSHCENFKSYMNAGFSGGKL
jgi:hypothetical protein